MLKKISAARPIMESPGIISVVVPGKARPAPPFVGRAVNSTERKTSSTGKGRHEEGSVKLDKAEQRHKLLSDKLSGAKEPKRRLF